MKLQPAERAFWMSVYVAAVQRGTNTEVGKVTQAMAALRQSREAGMAPWDRADAAVKALRERSYRKEEETDHRDE